MGLGVYAMRSGARQLAGELLGSLRAGGGMDRGTVRNHHFLRMARATPGAYLEFLLLGLVAQVFQLTLYPFSGKARSISTIAKVLG